MATSKINNPGLNITNSAGIYGMRVGYIPSSEGRPMMFTIYTSSDITSADSFQILVRASKIVVNRYENGTLTETGNFLAST